MGTDRVKAVFVNGEQLVMFYSPNFRIGIKASEKLHRSRTSPTGSGPKHMPLQVTFDRTTNGVNNVVMSYEVITVITKHC